MLKHPDEGFLATKLYRKISWPISSYVARFNITPNDWTFISLAICVIALISLYLGWNIFAAVLLFVSHLLDYVDGEVARIKNQTSAKGGYYDSVLDRVKEGLIFYFIIILLNSQPGYILGFGCVFGVLMVNYVLVQSGKMDKGALRKSHASVLGKVKIKQSYLTFGIDAQMTLIILFVLLGWLGQLLLAMAVLLNLYWLIIFVVVMNNDSIS